MSLKMEARAEGLFAAWWARQELPEAAELDLFYEVAKCAFIAGYCRGGRDGAHMMSEAIMEGAKHE